MSNMVASSQYSREFCGNRVIFGNFLEQYLIAHINAKKIIIFYITTHSTYQNEFAQND